MKRRRGIYYVTGVIMIFVIGGLILFYPFVPFFKRAFFILLFSCTLALYRILRGPTSADRAVALDMIGVLIVGFCAIMSISSGRSWYIDIAIAWALQSFIASLALAKFLEGKSLDD